MGLSESQQKPVIKISFDREPSSFSASFQLQNEAVQSYCNQIQSRFFSPELLAYEILQFFTPVFFEHLPADLSFEYSAAVQADQAAQDFFKKIEIILTETNKAFHGLPTVALKDNQCFIYNIDHSVVLEELKQSLEEQGCHCVEEQLVTGFNKVTRQRGQAEFFDLPGLVARLQEHRFSKIITLNMYICELWLAHHKIYLPAILQKLGVELISFDMDFFDYLGTHGLMMHRFFNDPKTRRFSVQPHLHREWNQYFQNNNVTYVSAFAAKEKQLPESQQKISQLYLLSHSRRDNIRAILPPILYLIDRADPENLIDDLVLWFFSARRLLVKHPNFDLPTKLTLNDRLMKLFEASMNFLKLVVLDWLEDVVDVHIYGDDGWKDLAPQKFKGSYLKEEGMRALLTEPNAATLLPNQMTSYLEGQPSLERAFSCQSRYVLFPTFVCGENLKGLKRAEFRNQKELLSQIEAGCIAYQDQAYQNAFAHYQKMMTSSYQGVLQEIAGKAGSSNLYQQEVGAHNKLFDERVETNLANDINAVAQKIDAVLLLKEDLNPTKSSYFSKNYVKTLLSSR